MFQYPDCKSKDASIVSKFENEVTSLYKIHPYRDELYIKIDRISGFMTLEHAWTNSVPKKNSFGFSFETNTSYNTYTCKPKTKTSF